MRNFFYFLLLLIFMGCRGGTGKRDKPQNQQDTIPDQTLIPAATTSTNPWVELRDTSVVDFGVIRQNYREDLIRSLIKKVEQQGEFLVSRRKNGQPYFKRDSTRNLNVGYDSAMKFMIMKEYYVNGVQIVGVGFKSKIKKRLRARFYLEEWTFDSNADRDRAYELIQSIYRHPKSIVMYFKSYPQFIKTENKFIILTTGYDIWEKHVVKYTRILEGFLNP